MTRSRWVRAGVVVIASFLAVANLDLATVRAQSSDSTSPIQLIPRTKAQREQKYEAEHRISLIVQVNDSSGKPVTGLKAEDFSLLDNEKAQKIATFREVDGKTFTADVHVMLVLDAINDGGSAIGHVKKDLDIFLAQDSGPLPFPISLVFVSEEGETATQPSTDRAAVASQLAQFALHSRDADCDQPSDAGGSRMGAQGISPQGQGNSAAARANCMILHFTESVNALRKMVGDQQNVRGRAILIWTGRGWPLLAEFGSHAAGRRGNYRDVLVELNTNLREAQVTLDAVSWGDFEAPRNVRKPIMSVTASVAQAPDEIAETTMALPTLARRDGGQAFAKVKNFGDAMSKFMDDARNFYVLSFDSTPAAAADELHLIEVKVDRPGMIIRTASGYYAQP
jgi:VWFA-related protein